MNKPKIAVLIDWFLPGTKAGGPVRSVYSLINALKNDFDFYLITSNCDLGDNNPYTIIKPNELFYNDGINYCYFDKTHLNQENILAIINKINPDLIYINSFWSASFSVSIVQLKNKNLIHCPLLLAPRGMLGKGARSLKSFKKNIYLSIAKAFGWYKNIIFHASQKQEESDIKNVFKNANIKIAPNINSLPLTKNISLKTAKHLKLFYLSRVARVKNLHFALEVLKLIPSEYKIEYDIFGNLEDKEYWQECQTIISELPSHVIVNYKHEISFDKIQSMITNYHCLYLPTLNENFGHAIVESLLCGCPAIISDQTPWNDLKQNKAGFSIELNNSKAFQEAILFYADLNQEQFNQASNFTHQYISSKINMSQTIELYKKLFNDCIKN